MGHHDSCRKDLHEKSILICSGPLNDPQSLQFWMLGKSLAQSGHRVAIVTDQCRHDLAGRWEGCNVWVWPSRVPERLQDWLFFRRLIVNVQPSAVISSFQ